MKFLKMIWNGFMFLLGGNSEIRKQAVDDGICDYSGEGRDSYGN